MWISGAAYANFEIRGGKGIRNVEAESARTIASLLIQLFSTRRSMSQSECVTMCNDTTAVSILSIASYACETFRTVSDARTV